jgi:hypothetical protein
VAAAAARGMAFSVLRVRMVSMNRAKATAKSAGKTAQEPAGRGDAVHEEPGGFTDEERAAMKERARELKVQRRRGARAQDADGERDVLAKIAGMDEPDRAMAERLHAIIMASAPDLAPRTWYGMPAYARDGRVVCFFQSARKFKTRYATLGFSDAAKLDAAAMWPVAFALQELTASVEAEISALVKRAVGRP